MANYLAAAVVSSGDVIGIYREYDGTLRLQWVNSSDPEEVPIAFAPDDLKIVIKVLATAEMALSTEKDGEQR